MSQDTKSYNEEYPDLPYIQTFQPFQLETKINKAKTIKTSYKKPCVKTYVHNNQVRHHLKKKKASFLFYKKQIFIGSGKATIKSSYRQTNTVKSTINKTTHTVKVVPKIHLKAKYQNIYTYLENEEVSCEELHNIKVNDNVNESEINFSQSNSNNLQNPSSKKKRNRQKKFKKKNSKKTFENEQKTSLYYQSFTEYASFLETIKKQDLTSCNVHQKFCNLEKKQIYIYLPDSGMSVFQSCGKNVLVSDIARHVKSKYNIPVKSQNFRTLNGKSLNKNSVINPTKIQNIALYFNLKGGVFKNNSCHENKKCGPCVLCGLDQSSSSSIRYIHLTETQLTWKSITDKKPDISMEDCLCRSCFRRLDKQENELKSGIPSKKKHIPCFLNQFNKCENPSEREVDYEPLLVEHFNVTIKEETMSVTLCHLHYLEYHNKILRLKNSNVFQCSNTTNLKAVTDDLLLKHNEIHRFSNNCKTLSNLNLYVINAQKKYFSTIKLCL